MGTTLRRMVRMAVGGGKKSLAEFLDMLEEEGCDACADAKSWDDVVQAFVERCDVVDDDAPPAPMGDASGTGIGQQLSQRGGRALRTAGGEITPAGRRAIINAMVRGGGNFACKGSFLDRR